MTRKRSGKTLVQQLMRDCRTCQSQGFVKSLASMTYELFAQCRDKVIKEKLEGPYLFVFSPDIFHFAVHNEYHALLKLEKELGARIVLELDQALSDEQFRIEKAA